ncbi:MAG: DUF1097 domain-containing protein [Spirochaetales bacterium]|jgi:hypothetical protein|nr:DUF1097 domain-containing protein [Spirochaetales bacterium]
MKKGNVITYLGGPLIIAILAAVMQAFDQLLAAHTVVGSLLPGGGSWIAFQAWAVYFLGGCNVKGGVKGFVSYTTGILASIIIMSWGGSIGGFWGVPFAILVVVIFAISLEKFEWTNYVPALFIGAGAYFGIMGYIAGNAEGALQGNFWAYGAVELFYCLFGLVWGFLTIKIRGAYDAKFN